MPDNTAKPRAGLSAEEKAARKEARKAQRSEGGAPEPHQAMVRAIAKMVWEREFSATQPEATTEAKREAWKAGRGDYMKFGRQVVRRAARSEKSAAAGAKAG